MSQFQGFPARMEFTSIPNVFFSGLLPEITDMAELKTTLHVMAQLYRKKGYPRYVSYTELRGDAVLMGGLRGGEASRLAQPRSRQRSSRMAARRASGSKSGWQTRSSPPRSAQRR